MAWRPVGLLALVVLVVHASASLVGGYWFDEVYMLAIGRYHLAWGSVDQPPLTPALAGLADALAPGSIAALRVAAVLATAAAVLVTALLAREFGGGRRAQLLSGLVQASGVWSALAGHWLTPYALEPVQWLVLFWLLVRWVRSRDDRLLPVVGLLVGVAAETKFQVLLLCAVLVVTVLVFGPRELLRRPLLWVGALVAVLVAAPTLYWQAVHGWPQLRMGPVVASEAQALYHGRLGIAVLLVVSAGVLGTWLSLYGLWLLLRTEWLRRYRFLGVALLVLYLFFVFTAGRPYYLAGGYGLLGAVGAVGLQRRRVTERRAGRWLLGVAAALSVLLAGALVVESPKLASAQVGATIAGRTATLYHALPPARRDHTVIMGQTYIVAAYLDGYRPDYRLPVAYSGNRGYGFFPPPPESADSVLFVGRSPAELAPYFPHITKVADGGPDASVWLCTGRTESWAAIWPRLRTLGVP